MQHVVVRPQHHAPAGAAAMTLSSVGVVGNALRLWRMVLRFL
jgi:cation transport ATPase